jgi:3'(2'), 5'-bisphosphate nucleotidase
MTADVELAGRLAATALRLLEAIRSDGTLTGKALGGAGDATANAFLVRALAQARPEDGLLSEEEKDNALRLAKSRVWIVDPLDGTREYGEGRDDFAVHVALSIDGAPSVAAVAMLDGTRTTADPRPGAHHGGKPRLVVSRSRPPEVAQRCADAIGAELVPMGSAGAKVIAVVKGEVDAYVHAGGQNEWDSAAPVGVALAAGLHCSRIDGSPLVYNQRDVLLPDLLICRPEYTDALLAACLLHLKHPDGV